MSSTVLTEQPLDRSVAADFVHCQRDMLDFKNLESAVERVSRDLQSSRTGLHRVQTITRIAFKRR
jgi:hypothetical protein